VSLPSNTIKEKDMAKVEGLNVRGSRYYVRVVIPDDLQTAYGKRRVNLSLGTSDRREATLLATLKRAEWLADFESKRSALAPSQLAVVSPELARLLAERVRAAVLGEDDRLRSDLPLLAEMVHMRRELARNARQRLRIPQWTPPEPREDDLTGMTPEEQKELSELNAYLDGKAAIALAGLNLTAVLPLMQEEAGRLGAAFTVKTPGAREALLLSLKAYRVAHREITQRDAGEAIDTPQVLTTALATIKTQTLRDVYDRWLTSGDSVRSADSVAACNRALLLYESSPTATPLKAITREQGDSFRAWLRGKSTTAKTARDRLNYIKSLLKYAAETLEWIPKHPWSGLAIDGTSTNRRRPWTDSELVKVFTTPLHTAYKLPKTWHCGQDAAYWIPLIGLFTGARLGELCQLRAVDVNEVEGIPVLVLTNEGESQSIKSDAGHRQVPIHSELIRLGFLEYVKATKGTGSASLWPAMRLREGKPSGFYSRWFSAFRKSVGLAEAYPDFHCFRHTVRPLMRRAGHSESTMDKITGHQTRGSTGTVTYDHWTLKELQGAVEAIQYPALALPKVWPQGQ
jgi:integrase